MSHRLRAVLGATVLVTLAIAAGCGTPGPSATEIQDEETPTTDDGLATQTTAQNDAGAEPVNPGVGTTSAGTGSPTDGDGGPADEADAQTGTDSTATTDESDGEATTDGSDGQETTTGEPVDGTTAAES